MVIGLSRSIPVQPRPPLLDCKAQNKEEAKTCQSLEIRTDGGNSSNGQCANKCPKGGKFDGANCFMGRAPKGTKAFLYKSKYYYTPQPGNRCTLPGSCFDGANCYVKPAPKGAKPFVYKNGWYYKSCPKR